MYYTTIKRENDLLFFFFCKNADLTGDVLERCKNRWSYGGLSRFANFQSINLNLVLMESLEIFLAKFVTVFKIIHF